MSDYERLKLADWKRTSGKPFADVDFLLQSVKRMNQQATTQPIAEAQKK